MATATQLRAAARNAGFRGAALTVAVAIALAESGGNENASHKNSNGTTDMGAWQINSVHKDLLAGKNPYDLQQNANMAYALYKGRGGNFADWVTAKTVDGKQPAYIAFLPAAIGEGGASGGKKHQEEVLGSTLLGNAASGAEDAAGAVAKAIDPLENLLSVINDAAFWKRLGIGFLAFILLLVGFILMLESNKTVRKATVDGAKAAAMV